jgi:hypothetical protein
MIPVTHLTNAPPSDVFKCTIDEKTIYLGPWEIVETEPRRIVWQCSYHHERLEHFLPPLSDDTADQSRQSIFPFTFHGKHTQFSRPLEGEQAVTFQAPHRLRYTSQANEVVFDQPMRPTYRFMTVASSLRFQADLRQKALVDCFDADIVWTDAHRRENMYGGAMGIAAIQRVKLWRCPRSGRHSLSVWASRWDRQHKEYDVCAFEADVCPDDKKRRVMLVARRRRSSDRPPSSSPFSLGSAGLLQWVLGGSNGSGSPYSSPPPPSSSSSPSSPSPEASSADVARRRPSISSNASSHPSSYAASFASSRTSISSYTASLSELQEAAADATDAPALGIRYLAMEFSLNRDYRRFLKTWARIHPADMQAAAPPPEQPPALDAPSSVVLPTNRSTRSASAVAVAALPALEAPAEVGAQMRDER